MPHRQPTRCMLQEFSDCFVRAMQPPDDALRTANHRPNRPRADASLFRHPARPLPPPAGLRSLPVPSECNCTLGAVASPVGKLAQAIAAKQTSPPPCRTRCARGRTAGCRLGYEAASPLSRTEFSSFALARGRLGHRHHSSRPHRAIFKQGLLAADGDVDRVRDHLRQVREVCIVEVGRQLEVVCRRE